MLKIHNTLTRQKEEFIPIEPGKVRLYVCGMTVYDYCHLGHARVMVAFDTVVRYLRHLGYAVTYVRNITDIDDKIIKRANDNGESTDALTARFIDAMHEDERALGVLPPDHEPRATASIAEIIGMIEKLIERGYAYLGGNGDVFYSINKFIGYGQLSGKNIDELRSGERVDVDEAKRDPLDFVLWKMAKPGEPFWESPWGQGRPGWHIECSAMSTCCLGNHFDIHGGGMDLQFPHHENEIAQSEGATGEKFVNLWMHNGFVRVNEEKMSKSLGNFFTVREILTRYRPETVRFFILNSHYRSPLNYCDENLDEAHAALTRLYTALRGLGNSIEINRHSGMDRRNPDHREVNPAAIRDLTVPAFPAETTGMNLDSTVLGDGFAVRFEEAMQDDFNTPQAISVLFDLAREINRQKSTDESAAMELAVLLKSLASVLGLLEENPEDYLRGSAGDGLNAEAIEELIQKRLEARKAKNWKESDRIRDELKAQGIILEDSAQGTRWRRG
ncbi:MAG: cysteine--tRNA ligase [Proteobacteria bacterium]|nr:cysteine--tRNA ligase [Pseudomonadota bacterium]